MGVEDGPPYRPKITAKFVAMCCAQGTSPKQVESYHRRSKRCPLPPPPPRRQGTHSSSTRSEQQDPHQRLLKEASPDLQPPPRLHLGGSPKSFTNDRLMPRHDTRAMSFHGITPDSIKVDQGQAQILDLELHLHGQGGEDLRTTLDLEPAPFLCLLQLATSAGAAPVRPGVTEKKTKWVRYPTRVLHRG